MLTMGDRVFTVPQANRNMSSQLGTPQSTAVTCIKPSGTVSQLTDSASGIHPRHSEYYIRRVRCNKDDPLFKFMVDNGVPMEDCAMNPASTAVSCIGRIGMACCIAKGVYVTGWWRFCPRCLCSA
jgi:hypothetical protein